MMDSRTDLHFFDTGSVTAQRCRYEVLEPYVRLFRGAVDPDFIFMDDNVPCHRTVLIDDFLETENIQSMSWPANSPDLNPIEHVWNMLGRQISALSHPPSSVTELKRALQEAWNRLSPQHIHHLIATAKRYEANGSHCEAMAVLICPKPIPKVNLVPRSKPNTAFVGFTRVNNQVERNNIQGNTRICQSKRMEQNVHR
ncbi:transposable element Tcb2 transposase [Trichonephila clavipes]|nr:transposable element Tcb2 transposase [Trichonephila clavipes]